jgi:Leucine-rich repeat (LRR) protein
LPATLEHVNLSYNAIEVIEPNAFRLLNKLKHLILDSNKLKADNSFPAFSHLVNLEHLSLKDNRINSLDGLKAISLPCLRVFDLHDSRVTKLSKQTFATLPGLVNLDLADNKITDIEAGAFDGLANLRVLNLVANNLKDFYFDVFESAANELGSPVNLLNLRLDSESLESVRWSPEMAMLVYEGTREEKKKQYEDETAKQFAKCGFQNKLNVRLTFLKEHDWIFLDALVHKDLVRLIPPYTNSF